VTGADGFVGSHLCEALIKQGAKVHALARSGHLKNLQDIKDIEIVKGDVLDYQSLLNVTRCVDVLFHLAAITVIPETRAMIANTFAVNSMGTLNVLMAAKESNVKKVVYASTCHVYGKQEILPISEENIPKPIDIYSASKLAGEHLCTSFVEMFGLDVSISRAFNHFGPRQREEFLVPTVVTKLLQGDKLKLGNPEPTRDYTHVSDIIGGYLLLAEKGEPGEVFQFCSGVERSVKGIVEDIINIGGFETEVEWNPGARRIDIPRSFGSYFKAKSKLGWEPKITFEEGIKKTIEWYKAT
jgi:nucleoside-diphosphate-sugar epimerase